MVGQKKVDFKLEILEALYANPRGPASVSPQMRYSLN